MSLSHHAWFLGQTGVCVCYDLNVHSRREYCYHEFWTNSLSEHGPHKKERIQVLGTRIWISFFFFYIWALQLFLSLSMGLLALPVCLLLFDINPNVRRTWVLSQNPILLLLQLVIAATCRSEHVPFRFRFVLLGSSCILMLDIRESSSSASHSLSLRYLFLYL